MTQDLSHPEVFPCPWQVLCAKGHIFSHNNKSCLNQLNTCLYLSPPSPLFFFFFKSMHHQNLFEKEKYVKLFFIFVF